MVPEWRTSAAASSFIPGGRGEAVRIGLSSVEYRKSSLEEVLRNLDSYGVRATELVARKNISKETVPQAKRLLSHYRIVPNAVSAFTKLNEVVHERVEETQQLINELLELAALVGAPYTITYFGTNALLDDDEAIERYVRFIQPCLRQAQETGVTLLIDNLFDVVPPEDSGQLPAALSLGRRDADGSGLSAVARSGRLTLVPVQL